MWCGVAASAGGCRRRVDRQGGDQCSECGGRHEGGVCGELGLPAALGCSASPCRAASELLHRGVVRCPDGQQASCCTGVWRAARWGSKRATCCTTGGWVLPSQLQLVLRTVAPGRGTSPEHAPTCVCRSPWAAPPAAAPRLSRRLCAEWTASACSARRTSAAGWRSQVRPNAAWCEQRLLAHCGAAGCQSQQCSPARSCRGYVARLVCYVTAGPLLLQLPLLLAC